MWSDLEDKPVVGHGKLDVKNIASFVEIVRTLASKEGVQASRVVGKFGLAYALTRMCRGHLGVEARNLKTEDLFAEKLYQVILVVADDHSFQVREKFAELQKQFGSMQLERIGQVVEGAVKLGEGINMKLSEVQSAYNTSWEVIFAGLS
jgi:phosphoribosylformylglycinamidine (FGAM) synthase-like enzyme